MKLIEVNGLDGIAKINHSTQTIMVNAERWNTLPAWQQKQILLHELGHNKLDTRNEFEADEFAFRNYVGTEQRSLKKSIITLKQNLNASNPEHAQRIEAARKRAAFYDYKVNGNKKFETMFYPDNEPEFRIETAKPNFIQRLKGEKESPKDEVLKEVEQLLENKQTEQEKNETPKTETETTETPQTELDNTEVETSTSEGEPNENFSFKSEWIVWVVLAILIAGGALAFFRFRKK